MTSLAILIPIALLLGLAGLVAFFWALRSGQFEDLDGAAIRILIDDDDDGLPPERAQAEEAEQVMKTCPRCQEVLKPDAIVCTHCGHSFGAIPATGPGGARPTPDSWKFGCAILIIAVIALALWTFSSNYLLDSSEGAAAIQPDPSGEAQPNGLQGR